MSTREPAERAPPPPTVHGSARRDVVAPPEAVSISSETLFGRANEVRIAHRGAIYRLKQTSLGKLILTK